ncbi:MAG: hypothetical protein Fues2KO_00120 [Fuerstiella sp.]
MALDNPDLLNVKLERAAVADLLDEIGGLLLQRAKASASSPGTVRAFSTPQHFLSAFENDFPNSERSASL